MQTIDTLSEDDFQLFFKQLPERVKLLVKAGMVDYKTTLQPYYKKYLKEKKSKQTTMKYTTDISKVTARKSVRHELQYIHFEGNRYVATDSFRLIEIETKDEPLKASIMVHADALTPGSTIDEATRTLTVPSKLGRIATMTIPKDPGVFPNYRQIMPSKESLDKDYVTIEVNASLLLDLVAIAKKMKAKRFRTKLSVHKTGGFGKALVLRTENDEEKATALLMPMAAER